MSVPTGLRYSGAIYQNPAQKLTSSFCPGSVPYTQVGERMEGGVSEPNLDKATVKGLVLAKFPGYSDLTTIGSFDKNMEIDRAAYASIQKEYCFYELRYIAAINRFVDNVANNVNDQAVIDQTVELNKRLNSLLLILDFISNFRSEKTNERAPLISEANKRLQDKIAALKKQQDFLESSDVHIRTQEEMMRYSAEKSRAMNIQIIFFVAINIVALGTIITVYKSFKPTVA